MQCLAGVLGAQATALWVKPERGERLAIPVQPRTGAFVFVGPPGAFELVAEDEHGRALDGVAYEPPPP